MADENTSLIPTIEVPDFVEETEEYDTEYRPSLRWDLEKGDFARDGTNRVPRSDGYDAYRVWCVKAVQTERYTCLAYSDDIGSEMEDASKEEDQGAVELAIARTIEETLMVNPRTLTVEGFEFTWEPGAVHVSFAVTAIDEEPFTVDATVEVE